MSRDPAYYIERQNLAYSGPSGTWAQRWLPFVCRHETVRCAHGDESIARRRRRRVCMVCGRALRGPIPAMCFFTERPHRLIVSIGLRRSAAVTSVTTPSGWTPDANNGESTNGTIHFGFYGPAGAPE